MSNSSTSLAESAPPTPTLEDVLAWAALIRRRLEREALEFPLLYNEYEPPERDDDTDAPKTARESLQNEVRHIKRWAEANRRDAKRDQFAYWSLKVPAFLAAASGALLHVLQIPLVGVVVDAIAAFCIALDAARPRGLLFNAHKRAAHELFALQQRVASDIDRIATLVPKGSQRSAYLKVYEYMQEEYARIAQSIKEAEANLADSKGSHSSVSRPPGVMAEQIKPGDHAEL
jgi:hypothetical protein